MSHEPLQLIVAVFEKENAASLALDKLKQAQKAHIVRLESSAVVRRREDNQLEIKEESDPGARSGALAGAVMGAIIGLLGGPGGAIVAGAAGAVIGGITAQVVDTGIPDNDLQIIGQSLLPSHSAIVLIVGSQWQDQARRLLAGDGVRVFSGNLTAIIAEQLELPPVSRDAPRRDE